MKYIIFANNKLVNHTILDYIDIQTEDVCVFFNHMIPLTIWPNLKNHRCKKYYFSRYRHKKDLSAPEMYAGLDKFVAIHDIFDKLYLYRMPHTLTEKELSDKCQACIEHYNLQSLSTIHSIYNLSDLKNKYSVNINKSLSSGLLMYLHLLDTKNINDEIYLIGFTSQVNINYHDAEQEQAFFAKELIKNYVKVYR